MFLNKEEVRREIELLANNNFGEWNTKLEAMERLHQACKLFLDELKSEVSEIILDNKMRAEIVEDMMEGYDQELATNPIIHNNPMGVDFS